ncbi:hypothetical protein ACFOU2_13125, partial [Bacillus songklensis]
LFSLYKKDKLYVDAVQLRKLHPTVISLLPSEAKSASLSGVPMPYGWRGLQRCSQDVSNAVT